MHRRSFIKIFILWIIGIVTPVKKKVILIEKKYELFIPLAINQMTAIYVSPDGNAAGAGTRVDPYDVDTGLALMTAADTLIFMDGIHRISGGTII